MSTETVNFPIRVGEFYFKSWMGYTPPKDILLHTSVELLPDFIPSYAPGKRCTNV